MKQIWSEVVTIAEGFNERRWDAQVSAWYDRPTGTLRIEMQTVDGSPYAALPCAGLSRITLLSVAGREQACRTIIATFDAYLASVQPTIQQWATADLTART